MATEEDVAKAQALLDALGMGKKPKKPKKEDTEETPTMDDHLRERAAGNTTTRYTELLSKQKEKLKEELQKANRLLALKALPKDSDYVCVVEAKERQKAGRNVLLVVSAEEADKIRRALEVADLFYRTGCNKQRTAESVKDDDGGVLAEYIEQCCVEAGVLVPAEQGC